MLLIFTFLSYLEVFNGTDPKNIDLYSIIGLKSSATSRDIEKSYQNFVSRREKSGSLSEKTQKYWKQSEVAYSILMEKTSKELYDTMGLQFLNQTNFSVFNYQSEFQALLIDQLYNQRIDAFGGIIVFPVYFTLKDAMLGSSRTVRSVRTVPCTCPRGGNRCAKCRSNPFMEEAISYNVVLPPGAPEFYRVFAEAFGDSEKGRGASDVSFVVRFNQENGFTRDGVDLHVTKKISLADAISGNPIEIENVDGEKITIPIADGVQHGEEKRFSGKGFPVFDDENNNRGNLYVRFEIDFPKKLSKDQIKQIEKILPVEVEKYE